MSLYTDEELRAMALPYAVNLVNQEVYRILNRCNTTEISSIVNEFVNIVKYGAVNAPETTIAEPSTTDAAIEVAPVKAKKVKTKELKYA